MQDPYVRFRRSDDHEVTLVSVVSVDVSVAGRFCDVRQHYEHGASWSCGRVSGHSCYVPIMPRPRAWAMQP